MRFFAKAKNGKPILYIYAFVYRDGRWVILDEDTFPIKKGELIRFRGSRGIYSVDEDYEFPRTRIKIETSLFSELI